MQPAGGRACPPHGPAPRHGGRRLGRMLSVTDHTTPLHEDDLDADPLLQFSRWYEQAGAGRRSRTAGDGARDGVRRRIAVASRMVLLKDFDERGFVFFSGYGSRKGLELQANPRAALLFHWDPLGRQVRVEGAVQRTSEQETAEYVRSRPRGSQLSALASPQSQAIASPGGAGARRRRARSHLPGPRAAACRTAGADSASCRRASSSGSSAATGCTTGCATAAPPAAGSWSAWPRSRATTGLPARSGPERPKPGSAGLRPLLPLRGALALLWAAAAQVGGRCLHVC